MPDQKIPKPPAGGGLAGAGRACQKHYRRTAAVIHHQLQGVLQLTGVMLFPMGDGCRGIFPELPGHFTKIIDHRITSRFLRQISSISRMYSWGYLGFVSRETWVPSITFVTPPEPRDKMECSSSIIYIL